ncbi:MAG: EAL domain-containing protein [Spongiibacteraceae bacterium]
MQDPVARILLVGSRLADYQRLQGLLRNIQRNAYQLTWCEAFNDAHNELSTAHFDVVLLDCRYQAELGLAHVALLTEQYRHLPVIILTDEVESDIARQAMESGADDYLVATNLNSHILMRCLGYVIGKRAADKKINQLNLYDPLTGTPNRILFRQTLEYGIEQAKSHQIPLALLLINLDGFRKINEDYGSEAGDYLVKTMAQRLLGCVRKSDGVARIGADEFTLVLDDWHGSEDVTLVAKKVIDVLSSPFTIAGQPLILSCSIGIALYPEAGDTVDGLLKRANMAMLEAKTQRGSQYFFYSEEVSADAMNRSNLEADLRRAIRAGEFEMYYQPRVDLGTGETVGMEALIRWHHPSRGMVSPQEFIPVAEECGLIVPMGYWVIQQVCSDMRMFDDSGHKHLDIAVNLSFKQLQDDMFVSTATRIIENSGVDTSRLEFELTETAIMSNYQQTYEGMMALSQLGVTFSLDDFGTGFSSFAHIQRLPISALKIDRSFIRNVVRNNDDAIIVKAMINLAHSLRLHVIAEGVETLDQVQFLWQNNCDQVQGFYFSPAVSASDFNSMVNQRALAVQ